MSSATRNTAKHTKRVSLYDERGSARNGLRKAVVVTQEQVEEERARLVAQRQDEVQRVLDSHDDLVRELFHLEHFVSLLSYDPLEAKKDTSNVFLQFKTRHDLVDQSTPAGPSRTTRRAHTERLQALQAQPTSISVPPRTKKKAAAKPDADKDVLWTLLAEAHSKGKGKEKAHPEVPQSVGVVSTPSRKGKAKSDAQALVGALEDGANMPSASHHRKRIDMPPPTEQPPNKKRKLDSAHKSNYGSSRLATLPALPASQTSSTTPTVRQTTRRSAVSRIPEPDVGIRALSDRQPLVAQSPIKRIKLIVRRPLPSLSSPTQKPPVPAFSGSLSTLLSSYTILEDQDLDPRSLAELTKKDVALWRNIDSFRRQGRLYLSVDGTSGLSGTAGLKRVPDAWDYVIEDVKRRAGLPFTDGRRVAAEIATRIKVYWEAQAVKDDKVKAQEERRLRALAKATIRAVAVEWKKAVFHIREQERLKTEAEERRRGDEHLDAILDQSGQILEAQQVDLSKGDASASRSRSSSVSATLGLWASGSVVEGDEEESGEESGSDSGNTERNSDAEEDIGSTLLLSDPRSALIRRGTSETTSEGELLFQSPSPISADAPVSRSTNGQFSDHSRGAIDATVVATYYEENSSPSFGHSEIPSSPSASKSVPSLNGSNRYAISSGHEIELSSDRCSPEPGSVPDSQLDDDYGPPTTDEPPETPKFLVYESLPGAGDEEHVKKLPWTEGGDLDALDSQAIPSYERLPISYKMADATRPNSPILQTNTLLNVSPPDPTTEGTEDVDNNVEDEVEEDSSVPVYLRPYAVARMEWDAQDRVKVPLLLRGTLRPYQQAGLEWLASLHTNNLNGILADEMGLGKTIQTISLLAHLACDRGIWGPHLIVVPTSVLLNWEMEFKKFLPGFKVLSYHGNTKRRKELRQGWNNKYHFNVCVTSYTLASRDAHVFKRKPWYYMILDEAHMIKNFKSQRWNILLMFRSFRRLLLTGTPLQNNLTELWALLQFLMSGTNFANLKEFGEWFANPLEKAIEMGNVLDDETQQRVSKLHTVLRPYLLRRLKRDVEKELPSKFEHLVMCPLSKRQRFLYDEFMARAETRYDLQSGVYQKIANILMQLRKVVNHPDLFEVRPIRTSFAMSRSAIADFEIKELLVRRKLLQQNDEDVVNLELLGFHFVNNQNTSLIAAQETRRLDGTSRLPLITELPAEPPPYDMRTIDGYRRFKTFMEHAATAARWAHMGYLNRLRCSHQPIISAETITLVRQMHVPILPSSAMDRRSQYLGTSDLIHSAVKSYAERAEEMACFVDRFAFVTPAVVARDLPAITLSGHQAVISARAHDTAFDAMLHRISVKLQIAFPDPSLLQYDCGKLQELAQLLRERKAGGHRVLIFTQMTRILDILEIFLNFHGYLYLRLDGATKIEDRQYITERFNTDPRIFCFISSSRSGGVGINLTGADTVIFYDSDFNPQMDRQCEDRAHRIGQIRDVHIFRFISKHTVEEALLRKANQKRSLDDLVIQKGEFDWRSLFRDEGALTQALGEFEDTEDAHAAAVAAREEVALVGADEADFGGVTESTSAVTLVEDPQNEMRPSTGDDEEPDLVEEETEDGGTTVDYMLSFIQYDMDFFGEWRL